MEYINFSDMVSYMRGGYGLVDYEEVTNDADNILLVEGGDDHDMENNITAFLSQFGTSGAADVDTDSDSLDESVIVDADVDVDVDSDSDNLDESIITGAEEFKDAQKVLREYSDYLTQ